MRFSLSSGKIAETVVGVLAGHAFLGGRRKLTLEESTSFAFLTVRRHHVLVLPCVCIGSRALNPGSEQEKWEIINIDDHIPCNKAAPRL